MFFSPPVMIKAGVGPGQRTDGLIKPKWAVTSIFSISSPLASPSGQSGGLAVMLYGLIDVCFWRHTHPNRSSLTSARASPPSPGLRCFSFQQ